MLETKTPPRVAVWLLHRCVPAVERESLLGDLEEEWAAVSHSAGCAQLWYWRQALVLSARLLLLRLRDCWRDAFTQDDFAPPPQEEHRMSQLAQDLRHGLRLLARKPGFALVAVLTLALGIGANAAVFSVVYGVVLHPLPYADPQRVVVLWQADTRRPGQEDLVSPANFLDWRARTTDVMESLGAVSPYSLDYTGGDEPETFGTVLVSDGYFQALGVKPHLGRTFQPEDHEDLGNAQVLVMTYGFWQQKFGGDPGIIGRMISFSSSEGEKPFTVVGILPPDFRSPVYSGRGLYAPLVFWPGAEQMRQALYLGVVGRLKLQVTLGQGQAAFDTVNAQIAAEHPREAASLGVTLVRAQDQLAGSFRPALWTLLGAAGLILLIACANVAHLQLARASERNREFAIRTALGAERQRLVRQLVTESFWLILAASVAGLFLAWGGVELLRARAPGNIPRLELVQLNVPVLAFGAGVALLTLLLFGLAPALHASRVDLQPSLKEGAGAASPDRGTHRLRNFLVVWEVALALVLLVGAGLLTRSFVSVLNVNPGFRSDKVVSLLVFIYARYPTAGSKVEYFRQALEKLRATPGVQAAGAVSVQPLLLGAAYSVPLTIEGQPAPPPGQEPVAMTGIAAGDYFRAQGIPLLRGRNFEDHDIADSVAVAIVSEAMARRFWPNEDPIGRAFTLQLNPPRRLEIVGVVGDVRNEGLDDLIQPQFYQPHAQNPSGGMAFVVNTASDTAALLPTIKKAIWSVNPQQPFYRVATMDDLLAQSLAQRRFLLYLLGTFAALALVLASVGIYGVISFLTARRTREIGLRMALGAQPAQILRMVMRQGVGLAAVGVAVGLAAAVALSRFLTSLLYGVSPLDPVAYSTTAALLLGVALLASYLPARRATRVDPIQVLRQE